MAIKLSIIKWLAKCENTIIDNLVAKSYYAYNDWAFEITQKHMQETGILTSREEFYILLPAHKELARTARTHEDLFKAAGNIPFVQVLPCGSIARPGMLPLPHLHLICDP